MPILVSDSLVKLLEKLPWEIINYIDELTSYKVILADIADNRTIKTEFSELALSHINRYYDPHTGEMFMDIAQIYYNNNSQGLASLNKLRVKQVFKCDYPLTNILKNYNKSKTVYKTVYKTVHKTAKYCHNIYISNLESYNPKNKLANINNKYMLVNGIPKYWVRLGNSQSDVWKTEFYNTQCSQCTAITRNGWRCKNKVKNEMLSFGHTRCNKHSFVFKSRKINL
tara:strand:- start:992 stop:1669 length:678 start_codon:yes stop_codon:yes gene_type:complete